MTDQNSDAKRLESLDDVDAIMAEFNKNCERIYNPTGLTDKEKEYHLKMKEKETNPSKRLMSILFADTNKEKETGKDKDRMYGKKIVYM